MRKFLKPSALATVLFLLLQALGTERSRSAEPIRVDFNGSLTDASGQFDGIPDSNLSYVTENNRTAVSFSGLEYVRFPMALSNSLGSQRLRFRIRFKISPDSQGNIGEGRIFLFGNERQHSNLPGYRMDIRSDGEAMYLSQSVGDGLGSDDRQGELGAVLPNKWYDIVATLELDREAPRVVYIFDDQQQFHELLVEEGFSLAGFRNHLSSVSPLQIGGTAYYPLGDTDDSEDDTGANLLVDHFIVEPTVAPGDLQLVKQTLNDLTAHVNGSVTMTTEQLKEAKSLLYFELDVATAQAALSELKFFLKIYEAQYGALFKSEERVPLSDLDLVAQTVFFVKQWMLDDLYVGGDLQSLEGFSFEEASVWPGVPKVDALRTTTSNPANLKINGTYNKTAGIQGNGSEHAYRMTGYYAAPGEIVSLTFPDEVLGKNIRVLVGVHFWNTYYVRPYNRLNRISLSYGVNSATVQVMNPMGGSILVRVPDGSNLGDLSVTVVNAVKTPYFSTRTGAETTQQEWEAAKATANIAWVEFESDKVQLSAPRALFDAGTLSPQEILAEWDSILDAFSIVGGRSLERTRPYFFMADRQNVAGGTAAPAANPLPLVPENDLNSWENFLDPRPNSNSNGVSAEFIVLHEMGHAHNYPTLGNQEQESNVNLPAVAAYNLTYGFDLTTDAMAQSIDQGLSLDQAAIDWMISPNFTANKRMSFDFEEWDQAWDEEITELSYVWNEIRYQSRGHAKFVELAHLYGWEAVGNGHAVFMNVGAQGNRVINYGIADDDFIRKASYANNKNLAPIFHFWGIIPSAKLAIELDHLPKATEFKARLERYQSIIPANNSAFRAYFAGLQTGDWTKGYWSDDRNGFQVFRYKGLEQVYDEARAKGMSDQIDYLLSVYFPQGNSVNQPPVIVNGPVSQTISNGTAFSIPMVVTDPDTPQDHLSFSLHFADPSRPNEIEGLSFNSKTGELYGKTDTGHEAESSPLKISVFDGTTEVFTDPFQFFFREPDKPGFAITNLVDLQVTAGQTLTHSFNIQGSIEGDFNFSVSSLKQPNDEFNPSWLQKDSLGITLTPSNDDIGEYKDLFIKFETPHVHIRSVLFSIGVVPNDDSLRLVGSPRTRLMAMRPYDFKPSLLKGSQVAGVVSFSASNLPNWLRLDASTGRIFGTPLANDGGTYSDITIAASNGNQSAVFSPFSIEVSFDGKLKILSLDSAYNFSPGQNFDIPVVLEDLDDDDTYMGDQYVNLRFADSKPEWINYDGASRPARLFGTVPLEVSGSYTLEFNVHSGKPFHSLPVTVVGNGDSGSNSDPNGESFGDVVIYANNSTTLIGQVTIKGEVAEIGDLVAIYVGSELRSKQEVTINGGVAWVNAQVNAAGGEETISFKVYDASTGVTHENSPTSAVITTGGTVGSFANPLMIEMKDFETQTLNLREGWNLVSFYVEADDMTPATVFAPIQDELLQIKNLTESYDPSIPSFLNTLSSLSVKDGYWLKVSEDVSLDVEGYVPSGASIDVKSGWNLVGYPRSSGEAVVDELTSLGDTVVQIKDVGSSYDPRIPSFLNTLSTMAPGSGYWLNVGADGTWTVGTVVEISQMRRSIAKTQPDHSPEEKAGPAWGEATVSPNLGATVLAQVSIQGKPVAKGGVVGVFVGNELRGLQDVVLDNGMSYVTLNVNLNGAESVSYRVWNPDDHNDYLVSGTMLLELGSVYGNPELVKLNAVTVSRKPLEVFKLTSEPFGFSFNTTLGRNYTVEATGNLRRWKAVELFQGSGGEIRFTAKPTSSGGAQFFRVFVK
jgi:hypothetical protein